MRDITEKTQTAEIDMRESERRADIAAQHIAAQKMWLKLTSCNSKLPAAR